MNNDAPLHLITIRVGASIVAAALLGALWSWWRLEHPEPGIDILPVFTMAISAYSGLLGLVIVTVGAIWGGIRRTMMTKRERMNPEGCSTTTDA